MRFAKRGFYKDVYCRSLGEFHYAMFLDLIEIGDFKFCSEGIKYKFSSRNKIPDFVVVFEKQQRVRIVEIKSNSTDINLLKQEYINNFGQLSGYLDNNFVYEFVFINSKEYSKKVKNIISVVYGEDFYNKSLELYKNQIDTYTGFPGELNPMFGKKHSQKTKDLISQKRKGKYAGNKNPNFGKTHTAAAKEKIGAKWHDSVKKHEILSISLLNKIKSLNTEQYNEFCDYARKSLSGEKVERPYFMNGTIKVSNERIVSVFSTVENFWNKVRGCNVF